MKRKPSISFDEAIAEISSGNVVERLIHTADGDNHEQWRKNEAEALEYRVILHSGPMTMWYEKEMGLDELHATRWYVFEDEISRGSRSNKMMFPNVVATKESNDIARKRHEEYNEDLWWRTNFKAEEYEQADNLYLRNVKWDDGVFDHNDACVTDKRTIQSEKSREAKSAYLAAEETLSDKKVLGEVITKEAHWAAAKVAIGFKEALAKVDKGLTVEYLIKLESGHEHDLWRKNKAGALEHCAILPDGLITKWRELGMGLDDINMTRWYVVDDENNPKSCNNKEHDKLMTFAEAIAAIDSGAIVSRNCVNDYARYEYLWWRKNFDGAGYEYIDGLAQHDGLWHEGFFNCADMLAANWQVMLPKKDITIKDKRPTLEEVLNDKRVVEESKYDHYNNSVNTITRLASIWPEMFRAASKEEANDNKCARESGVFHEFNKREESEL